MIWMGSRAALTSGVGCSGEVKISRNGENYATWGIHILVSYRNDQAMQLLTGTLQSGGVRTAHPLHPR